MLIRYVMNKKVKIVDVDASLEKAALLMRDYGVGFLPVLDGERLQGVITDRDLAVRGVAQGRDPESTLVRQIMTRRVVTCFEDEPVSRALQVMRRESLRRLVILDEAGRIAGVLALDDVARVPHDEKAVSGILEQTARLEVPTVH